MLDLLRRQFRSCQPPFRFGVNPHRYLYFVLDRFRPTHRFHVGVDACLRVMATTEMPCLKTHSTPAFPDVTDSAKALCEEVLRDGITIYCVRDVRPMLASLYAFQRAGGAIPPVSLGEYIRQEVDGKPRPRIWAEHVRSWLELDPQPHVVRYEDVVNDPGSTVEHLASWLGREPERVRPILPPRLRCRQRLWLARLTGVPKSTNIMGRKLGIRPPDWRTAYSDADLAFLEEHAGEEMRRLGYIAGQDWSAASSNTTTMR